MVICHYYISLKECNIFKKSFTAKLQELCGWHELALIPDSPSGIGKSGKRSCKMMNYGNVEVRKIEQIKKKTLFSIEKTIMFIWGINEYVIHIISWSCTDCWSRERVFFGHSEPELGTCVGPLLALLRRYQSYGRWFWWGIYSRGAMTVPCIQVEQTTSLTSQIDDVDTITLDSKKDIHIHCGGSRWRNSQKVA